MLFRSSSGVTLMSDAETCIPTDKITAAAIPRTTNFFISLYLHISNPFPYLHDSTYNTICHPKTLHIFFSLLKTFYKRKYAPSLVSRLPGQKSFHGQGLLAKQPNKTRMHHTSLFLSNTARLFPKLFLFTFFSALLTVSGMFLLRHGQIGRASCRERVWYLV